MSQNQPDQIKRSTPIDNIYRLFCLPFSPHYFQRQDMALPFRVSWGTCFWVHMYYESNNKCWEHPPVYLLYVHNQLDFLHTVGLWLSARMQSLCNKSKFNFHQYLSVLSFLLLLLCISLYLRKFNFLYRRCHGVWKEAMTVWDEVMKNEHTYQYHNSNWIMQSKYWWVNLYMTKFH